MDTLDLVTVDGRLAAYALAVRLGTVQRDLELAITHWREQTAFLNAARNMGLEDRVARFSASAGEALIAMNRCEQEVAAIYTGHQAVVHEPQFRDLLGRVRDTLAEWEGDPCLPNA